MVLPTTVDIPDSTRTATRAHPSARSPIALAEVFRSTVTNDTRGSHLLYRNSARRPESMNTRSSHLELRASTVLLGAALLIFTASFVVARLDSANWWSSSYLILVLSVEMWMVPVVLALSLVGAFLALVLLVFKRRWQFLVEFLLGLALGFTCLTFRPF